MKYMILLALFSLPLSGHSQSFSFHIDHYSMIVEDLQKTGDFYSDVLRLQDIRHPSKAAGFRWFSIDGTSQLHLIRKDKVDKIRSKSEHLCLSLPNLEEFIDYLKEKNISFWDWEGTKGAVSLRGDGVRQIYLLDPEGNWVEINNAKG
ncbi:VOC family protein [Muriicola soli]|uniref:VOC family protein n=1 Tax=Muriicola soli TaxID=2507538 RepID=A0A411E8C1_9FLAO|nr:VOC family protein [Muriicola soli]QBA63929.1 VOC family protein [Muriicola soli]